MKIAGLGQKKNDDTLSATFLTDFELPPLAAPAPATAQPAVAPATQPVAQPTPAPQPVAQPTPAVAPQPVVQPTSAVAPAPQPEVQPTPTPAPQPTQPTATAAEGAQTEARPRRRIAGTRPSVGSFSIKTILNDTPSPRATATESSETVEVVIDKASQEKLLAARTKILAAIKRNHPRHLSVFENMVVEQNTVTVKVPSRDQGDELSRSHIELGRELATIAEVDGVVKLEVIVDEQIRADRPIKIEDRLRHMTAKNERLIEMMERLNLDAE